MLDKLSGTKCSEEEHFVPQSLSSFSPNYIADPVRYHQRTLIITVVQEICSYENTLVLLLFKYLQFLFLLSKEDASCKEKLT